MDFFFQLGVYIPLLPALLAFWKWKKLNVYQRWFGFMLGIVALISIAGRVWTLLGNENNLPFFHTYILIECLFLLFIFKSILSDSLPLNLFRLLILSFPIYWIYNVSYGEGLFNYPANSHAIEALIMMGLSVSWFAKVLKEKEIRSIQQTFEFWFATGVIIFYSSNFLFFLFSSFIVKQNHHVFKVIWGVHAILAILLYLIYTIAIRWAVKTPKSY